MPVAKAQTVPKPVQAPQPVPITPSPEDFFEMFAQSGETVAVKRRQKDKMRRFIMCEGIAIAVLLPLAIVGIAFRPENAALHWIVNILTIAAAVAAALIPILFFAVNPTLPEIER